MMSCLRRMMLLATAVLAGCDIAGPTALWPVVAGRETAAVAITDQVDDPPARQSGRKLALLVGCTAYPNLKNILPPLQGPANDVALMRKVLRDRFHFLDGNIVTLAETSPAPHLKPTRRNIQREFEHLARTAGKGDQIVILMSGHGSQQPDQEPFDEIDGLDQIFLPSDAAPWKEEAKSVVNAIVDDELGRWAKAVVDKGASLWVIMDFCHSGTALRGDSGSPEVAREVPPDRLVPRGLLDRARKDANERFKNGAALPASWLENAPGLAVLYACQSNELTVERPPYDGSTEDRYGLLTYTLCKTLTSARSPMTYRELAQRINSEYIANYRIAPTPLVEGKDADREVLGLHVWPGRSRFLLARAGEDGWKVTAGRLNGLYEKTILAVYPPAGSGMSGKPVGHVAVRTSYVTVAEVVPCAHAGMKVVKDLPVDGRCEPVHIDYGSLQLAVGVSEAGAPEGVKRLRQQLQGFAGDRGSLIALAQDPRQADWLFQMESDRVILTPAHAVWSKTRNPPPVQRLAFALDEADRIQGALEKIARVGNLLKLTAVSGEEAARGRPDADIPNVDMIMLKLKGPRDKVGTPVKDAKAALKSGDWVAIRVHNRSDFAVDVTLLHIDDGFGIEAIFPSKFTTGSNRLQPGQVYRTLSYPIPAAKTAALEHMVLIAVRAEGQPLDFTCLAQPTLSQARQAGGDKRLSSPLGQLLKNAMYGRGSTRNNLSTEEINNHILRVASWYVEPTSKADR